MMGMKREKGARGNTGDSNGREWMMYFRDEMGEDNGLQER